MEGLISLREASKISGYHQDYLSFLIRQNKLSGIRVGRNWGVNKQDLLNFMSTKPDSAPRKNGQALSSNSNARNKSVVIYLIVFISLILIYVISQLSKNSTNITENTSKNVGQFQTNILFSEENEFSSSKTATNSLK